MEGETQLKVIYWVTPIGLLARGMEKSWLPQGPFSILPVDSEGRGWPLVAHIFKSPTLPPPFDRNMYCEEWRWGGGMLVPCPPALFYPSTLSWGGDLYLLWGSGINTTSCDPPSD